LAIWSAVRLEGGQIVDEYRIVGDNGETCCSTTTVCAFNAVLDQWELISAKKGTGLQDFGTGRFEHSATLIERKFAVMSPTPSIWRIRYQVSTRIGSHGLPIALQMAARPGERITTRSRLGVSVCRDNRTARACQKAG
jgi:hypothetical protein